MYYKIIDEYKDVDISELTHEQLCLLVEAHQLAFENDQNVFNQSTIDKSFTASE